MPTALGSLKLTDLLLLDGEGGGGLTDTDDLPEGATNLYYTDARARAAISVQSNVGLTYAAGVVGLTQDLRSTASPTFGGLTLGALNGVLKASAGAVAGSATTGDLPEGSNLYYTTARVAAYLTGLSGTDDSTTFLRGDNTWSNTLTGGLNLGTESGAGAGEGRFSGGLRVSGGGSETALGVDNIRLGVLAGTPRIIWEDASSTQWEVDNSAGTLRFINPGSVRMTLDTAGTLTLSGGLNVGTASGASAGQVRASGDGFFDGGLNVGAAASGASAGEIRTQSHVWPQSHNTVDLGTTAVRWRDVWCQRGAFNGSLRALKTDIEPLTGERALALVAGTPIYTYRYKSYKPETDPGAAFRHAGYMADEVDRLLSPDGKSTTPGTAAALCMAAIRELERRLSILELGR